MRNRKLIDILAVALLLATGSALAPLGRSAASNQASVVWGSVVSHMPAPHKTGGRG